MWTVVTHGHILSALNPNSATISFTDSALDASLCATIGAPAVKHLFLELYSPQHSEVVIAYACVGGVAQIGRAKSGTQARGWPADTCVRVVSIVAVALCLDENGVAGTSSDCAECAGCGDAPLGGLTVTAPLKLDLTNPCAPVLSLNNSGVAPGDYCGLEVSAKGLITAIPLEYPSSCVPVLDPCGQGNDECEDCTGGGTGIGATLASLVSYQPQSGASIALGVTAQQAIEELEDYIAANYPTTSGVLGVASLIGDAYISTQQGAAGVWSIAHRASSLMAGVYRGFRFDAAGHCIGFTNVGSGVGLFAGAGLTATMTSMDQWSINANAASAIQPGMVQFAPAGALAPAAPSVPANTAISYGNLSEWWTTKVNYLSTLPLTTTVANTDFIELSQSGVSYKATVNTLRRAIGGPLARGTFNAGVLSGGNNVASIVVQPTKVTIIMASASNSAAYQVMVTREDSVFCSPKVTRASLTTFDIEWVDASGVIAPPSLFSFVAYDT
jgi:hypothetical protein